MRCRKLCQRWSMKSLTTPPRLIAQGLKRRVPLQLHHPKRQCGLRMCFGPRARLRAEKRGGRRWRRRATTRVYSCFYSWHATAPQHPTSSKTSTHAQFQRYCARGSRARLGAALGGLPTKTYPLQCPRGHDGEGGAKSCASTAASTAGMRCVQPLVGTWS